MGFSVPAAIGAKVGRPDRTVWAVDGDGLHCVALRVESPDEVGPAINKANEIDDRPVVLEFRTDSSESNDDIVVDPIQEATR